METVIPITIRNNPKLLTKVEQATKLLETKLGDFVEEVKAEWTPTEDKNGHPLLDLTISDWSGKVQERFSATQLDDPSYMKRRLNWLWGDLLAVRNKLQLKQLRKLIDQL